LQEGAQGFRANERGVAGENQDVPGAIAKRAAGDHESVTSATLRLLKDWLNAQRFDGRGYFFGLMAYNGINSLCAKRAARTHDIFDKRAASNGVQDLCVARAEASAFACAEDHNHEIGDSHRQSIVC
jgi:hypothetical protein